MASGSRPVRRPSRVPPDPRPGAWSVTGRWATIPVLVDVGFADPVVAEPDELTGPGLLEFAGLAPARVPVLPLPRHVAEKVHAYTRSYGASARRSTRPKDLVDILLIAASEPIDAKALRTALETTFSERQRQAQSDGRPRRLIRQRIAALGKTKNPLVECPFERLVVKYSSPVFIEHQTEQLLAKPPFPDAGRP